MSIRQESRSKYEAIRRFTAYRREEGFAGDPRTVESGAIIWADPDFWKEKRLEGTLVVRFIYNDNWFYVDRETFVSATRRVSVAGQ